MTYEIWSGYLPDHYLEEYDDYTDDYEVARSCVLDALEEEGRHASHEADTAESHAEYVEWTRYSLLYESAIRLLTHTTKGDPFDVTIRDERFAIVEA